MLTCVEGLEAPKEIIDRRLDVSGYCWRLWLWQVWLHTVHSMLPRSWCVQSLGPATLHVGRMLPLDSTESGTIAYFAVIGFRVSRSWIQGHRCLKIEMWDVESSSHNLTRFVSDLIPHYKCSSRFEIGGFSINGGTSQ